VTADTSPERGGWHMHEYASGPLCVRAENCHEDRPPSVPCSPVLVVPVEGLAERLHEALGCDFDGWEGCMDHGVPDNDFKGCRLTNDLLLALLGGAGGDGGGV